MQSALPVLMYHHVSPHPGLVTVSPTTFRDHMEMLARRGWRTLGSADLERFFAGEPLPDKSVVVTFDDGYLDNFVHAHPVLARLGQTALNFVVTGWAGEGAARTGQPDCPDHRECKRRIAAGDADSVILRWSEMAVMQAAGTFEFHSHTHTHTRWDRRLPDNEQRLLEMQRELRDSQHRLELRLGVRSRHLCWPQGYYQPDYVDLAQQEGYRWIYTTEARTNLARDDGLHVGRIVTKDLPASWLEKRLAIYASAWRARLYGLLKGA